MSDQKKNKGGLHLFDEEESKGGLHLFDEEESKGGLHLFDEEESKGGLHLFDEEESQSEEPKVEESKEPVSTYDNRFMLVEIGKNQYAIPLLDIREVLEPQDCRNVPNTNSYFLGITNLRGEVVNVFDSRPMLGVENYVTDEKNVLLIFNYKCSVLAGLVDRVKGVVYIEEKDLSDIPHFSTKVPKDSLLGFTTIEDNIVTVCNMQKMLFADQISTHSDHQMASEATL